MKFMKFYFAAIFFAAATLMSCQEDSIDDVEISEEEISSDIDYTGLVINEVGLSGDFVEIYNSSDDQIDLSDLAIGNSSSYDDSDAYLFTDGSTIDAGEFIVIYKDTDFTFEIDDSGDYIYILDSDSSQIDAVAIPEAEYDMESYGRSTDGGDSFEWFVTSTPGESNVVAESESVSADYTGLVINEIASSDDFVEIYNGSDAEIDLSGFIINDSDSYDSDAYLFAEGSTIGVGEFIVVYKDTDFGFGIGSSGDDIYLLDANELQIDMVTIPAAESGMESYGRTTDGGDTFEWFATSTPGESNVVMES